MYYKIENKESEVYKKLHEMRTFEQEITEENKKSIKDKVGLDFEKYLGHTGQQNFRRVTQYEGFAFTEPEKVNLKIWTKYSKNENVFVPNRKTKLGREMSDFLLNGLKGNNFNKPLEILDLDYSDRFTFPFVDIVGETIILFLDEQFEPKDVNVVEITKREFEELRS